MILFSTLVPVRREQDLNRIRPHGFPVRHLAQWACVNWVLSSLLIDLFSFISSSLVPSTRITQFSTVLFSNIFWSNAFRLLVCHKLVMSYTTMKPSLPLKFYCGWSRPVIVSC